ncbi:hypothetical protein [Pedobacter sp.]
MPIVHISLRYFAGYLALSGLASKFATKIYGLLSISKVPSVAAKTETAFTKKQITNFQENEWPLANYPKKGCPLVEKLQALV